MFAVLGEETGFCEWVVRLGGEATLAAPTRHGGWSGVALLYLQAQVLFGGSRKAEFRAAVEGARRDGALLAVELGHAGWIKKRGGSQAAYELAMIRPDILFATEASSAELGVPLEGLAAVPVTLLDSGGCSVHGPGPGRARDANEICVRERARGAPHGALTAQLLPRLRAAAHSRLEGARPIHPRLEARAGRRGAVDGGRRSDRGAEPARRLVR